MSDLLSAAAAALGTPETLVQRSAEARAVATGANVDEILSAWAGGEAVTTPSPEPVEASAEASDEAPPADAVTAEPSPESEPAVAVIEVPAVAASRPVEATAPSGQPPVLVGTSDNPMNVLVAAVALFVAILLLGLVGPSVPLDSPGARSSKIAHSDAGEAGQTIYASVGCAACHTQMVRPIVSDVGLGAVSLNDSNQILGTRRFGPDLSDIGRRKTGTEIEAIIGGFGGHSDLGLSSADMNNLVTYLVESSTSESG